MKKIFLIIAILFQLNAVAQQPATGIEHVIVIGIDALSVEGLKKASTPNMDKLIRNGALCEHVRTVQPSSSAANWGSMLMGAGTEIHGVTNNDWRINDHSLKAVVVDKQGFFPTVLSVIRAQRADAELGMIYHWSGFGDLFEKGLASVDKTYPTQEETALAMAAYIKEKKPMFLFSQFDDVDAAGHHDGHMSQGYMDCIGRTDSLVGIIVDAVKEAGIENKTMIMIVSDHGGIGLGHGGTTQEEITVPFILRGKGIKQNYSIPTEVYMFDVAPTITYALGLKEPYAWRGKAIRCAFEGNDSPIDPLPLIRFANPPKINGGRASAAQQGGLYVDKTAIVKIEGNDSSDKIYYTTDGTDPTQESKLYTAPFTLNKTTVVKAKSFGKNDTESFISEAYFRIVSSNEANGVNVSYFEGKEWNSVPDFRPLSPDKTWKSPEISLDREYIKSLMPEGKSSLGLQFESLLEIDQDGEYTFYLQSDDGSLLYVNDQLVVNNDGDHGVIEKQGTVKLTKGRHHIRVGFINVGGGFWIETLYRGPGIPKQIIPANKLFLR
ncbi:hypothetical protein GGR21_000712 [Dysgonomonas hofstadii]|uniref:PA14 domain-containing protein n=1 Tax=Dysgonomonas hofstadii TaxID=637886 RepID=A0A840CPC6_9BACT|nr:alkaline phosphatase family protein [Dysgonomonas hofstadii]MBB4034825.1 hypothetical protein [Dysgonomonas hofstadii]